MTSQFEYPADLAEVVRERLRTMHRRAPALATLVELLEVAYQASKKTEEAEPVRCTLTYISSTHPDPNPPERIVADRWSYARFKEPIHLTVSNLIKISKSIDGESGSLAVDKTSSGELMIWGAIDQRGWRAAYVLREVRQGAETPGVIEVSITGVGSLEVYKDYVMVAALREGRVAFDFNDVLGQPGPILRALQPGRDRLVGSVRNNLPEGVFARRDHWVDDIAEEWRRTLARILLGVQRYGHGGAIVITAGGGNAGLAIKYEMEYARLRGALLRMATHTILRCDAEDATFHDYIEKHADLMPVALHLDEVVSKNDEAETRDEITGAIRFIASLSRVDGLITMDTDLSVRGYGGVITVEEQPTGVWVAGDESGSVKNLRRIDPRRFGTRHQSMMRFCFAQPGAVGFVISQDGDVRAMTRVRQRLVVWQDVKLRLA